MPTPADMLLCFIFMCIAVVFIGGLRIAQRDKRRFNA